MKTALILAHIVVLTFGLSRLAAQGPSSNHIAFQKLQDASHYWCPTSAACNPPTIKQCRADLAAWNQADHDWKDAVLKAGKPYDSPVELLSTEELYRRREEASMCGHVLAQAGIEAGRDKTLKSVEKASRFQNGLLDQLDMSRIESELLKESLSRTESVIDNHQLWEELLLRQSVK